ncbi:hypothetical protein J6590_086972 [Homalodisca vitripennis]|nr:hypothetical protein J6590_086972 [Homalodisca vitripennis]
MTSAPSPTRKINLRDMDSIYLRRNYSRVERLCSRTPASTVLYRTGHSVINYSFAVVLCVSESVKDIFRLHACLQDCCSLFPHLLITTWPSTTADYG